METDLFVHFAEIAGVFVGFGALISQRSARPTDLHDVVYLRAVLGLGVWVVLASLVPIAVSRYGVHGDALWRPCAVVALTVWVLYLVVFIGSAPTRELNKSTERMDRYFPVVGLPLHVVIAGSLVLVILGVWPDVEEALYVTALAAGVAFAGYTLLVNGMSQVHTPATTGTDVP
jgi:hypothetical protein